MADKGHFIKQPLLLNWIPLFQFIIWKWLFTGTVATNKNYVTGTVGGGGGEEGDGRGWERVGESGRGKRKGRGNFLLALGLEATVEKERVASRGG